MKLSGKEHGLAASAFGQVWNNFNPDLVPSLTRTWYNFTGLGGKKDHSSGGKQQVAGIQ